MTTNKPRRLHRLAKIGDKIEIHCRRSHPSYPNGTVAVVRDIITGCCGPILAVEVSGYGVVDLFWKKVRAVK